MARKTPGHRCPSCRSHVLATQNYCPTCGAALVRAVPVRPPSRFRALLGKAFIGALALAIVIGAISRLLPDDESGPPVLTEIAGNLDLRPTRTPAPPSATSVPPSRTAVPATEQVVPSRILSPRATRTPRVVATRQPSVTSQPSTATSSPSQSDSTSRRSSPTPEPSPTRSPANAPSPTLVPSPTQPATRTPPPTLTAVPPAPTLSGLAFAATDCSGYDAWEWAQSVYETDPQRFAALDQDGDGTACPTLPSGGFAPAFWTTGLPTGVAQGNLVAIIDGDTFEITVDGQTSRYRLYRANTPEVAEASQCGGSGATDFVRFALGFNDTPGQVWVEDAGQRDPYGRRLAYLWFTVAGQPYLLNYVLINNGWAEDIDYGDDFDPYPSQLRNAASFAEKHRLDVWAQCGGFGVALPTQAPMPTQAPLPTDVPFVLQPTQAPMGIGGGCDPNYTPCVPNVSYDLDCGDIQVAVQVIGVDRHRFDREGDGLGCESYG